MAKNLIQLWSIFAIRGVIAVLFGIVAFLVPVAALRSLVFLFSAFMFVDGLITLLSLFQNKRSLQSWSWTLVDGIAGIGIGLLTFMTPGLTAMALSYFLATWVIITGIFKISNAIRLRKTIQNEWALGLAGVCSVVFGLLMLSNPGVALISLMWMMGAYALVFGFLLIKFSVRLKHFSEQSEAPSSLNANPPMPMR